VSAGASTSRGLFSMMGSTEVVCSFSFLEVRLVFLILGTIGCSIGFGSSLTMSLTGSCLMTGGGTGAGGG
jgi:hypothetical protein